MLEAREGGAASLLISQGRQENQFRERTESGGAWIILWPHCTATRDNGDCPLDHAFTINSLVQAPDRSFSDSFSALDLAFESAYGPAGLLVSRSVSGYR